MDQLIHSVEQIMHVLAVAAIRADAKHGKKMVPSDHVRANAGQTQGFQVQNTKQEATKQAEDPDSALGCLCSLL